MVIGQGGSLVGGFHLWWDAPTRHWLLKLHHKVGVAHDKVCWILRCFCEPGQSGMLQGAASNSISAWRHSYIVAGGELLEMVSLQ